MSKNIGNLKVSIEIEITEVDFNPRQTLPKVLEIVKNLPKEFDNTGVSVKCYYGWLDVYKDSHLSNLIELSDLKHYKFYQQKDS